jgi:hypothetical protein
MVDAEILVDFAGALALIGMLSVGFGILGRMVAMPRLGPLLLGTLFGAVAVLGMLAPLSPAPGVLVDMRCVPVALAGAFLGMRGLVFCVLLAGAARFGIGGEGSVAGIAAIVVSGLAGWTWRAVVPPSGLRRRRHFIALGAATSSHLLTGLLLPDPAAAWFYITAAPILLVINMAAVPLFGALLDHELRSTAEASRAGAAGIDPSTGTLSLPHFERSVARGEGVRGPEGVGALLIVRIGSAPRGPGRGITDLVLREARVRLEETLGASRPMARLAHDCLVVAATRQEAADERGCRDLIRAALREVPFRFEGGCEFEIVAEVTMRRFEPGEGGEAVRAIRRSARSERKVYRMRPATRDEAPDGDDAAPLPPGQERMFARYDASKGAT